LFQSSFISYPSIIDILYVFFFGSDCSIVVDINGHTVSYEGFYNSLKARGNLGNDVMAAYVEVFNERVNSNSTDKSSLKISFSPYFTVIFFLLISFYFIFPFFFVLFMFSCLHVVILVSCFCICRQSLTCVLNVLMPSLSVVKLEC
jgi:hypothetical protein